MASRDVGSEMEPLTVVALKEMPLSDRRFCSTQLGGRVGEHHAQPGEQDSQRQPRTIESGWRVCEAPETLPKIELTSMF